MPAGLIHDQHGVGIRSDGLRYLPQMQVHGGGVAERQHQPGALAFLWADGTEDIGRFGALIMRRARPGTSFGPSARDLVFLADPRFILKPNFYPCALGLAARDIRDEGGEVFLNASMAYSFCA